MTQIQPLSDRVVLKPVQEDNVTKSGIYLPEGTSKERPFMYEVVAVGPGRKSEFGHYIGVNAKVGDIVLVPKIGTLRIDFEGDEYYIVQDREILATVKETEDNG